MKVLPLLLTLLLLTTGVQSDPVSGPGRSTLIREGWGTVFIDPSQVQGDYEVSMDETGTTYTITTSKGAIVVHEDQDDVTIIYPDFRAEVVSDPERLLVKWGEAHHVFTRKGEVKTYEGPIGSVEFVKEEGRLTVTGPQGSVVITESEGSYTIESPLGRTEYLATPKGYKLSGIRVTEHPYLRRGAIFSHNGLGVYVELALFDPRSPIYNLLDWDTIVEVKTSGP